MITYLSAIILGLVEGLTEFLPISSTAHLILTSHLLSIAQVDFVKTFEIVIQSGAILAVIVHFWKKLLNIEIWKRLIVAFIPTGLVGLLLYPFLKEYLLGNINVVLWALALGGLVLIFYKGNESQVLIDDTATLSYKTAALIGLAQAVAIVPGVSRSAATIIGGMMLGVSKKTIVEFSFLLAIPTIVIATGFDLIKNVPTFSVGNMGVLITGFIISFVSAAFSIKFLLSFVEKHSFKAFGVYRVMLVIIFVLFLL